VVKEGFSTRDASSASRVRGAELQTVPHLIPGPQAGQLKTTRQSQSSAAIMPSDASKTRPARCTHVRGFHGFCREQASLVKHSTGSSQQLVLKEIDSLRRGCLDSDHLDCCGCGLCRHFLSNLEVCPCGCVLPLTACIKQVPCHWTSHLLPSPNSRRQATLSFWKLASAESV
jgi:hypothetical protein